MNRSTDRILTSHVGSLMRPESIQAYAAAEAQDQPIDMEAYEADLRKEVETVVRQQAEHGVDIVSDGEFGKLSWTAYSLNRLTGFVLREDPDFLKFLGHDRLKFEDYFEESLRTQFQNARRKMPLQEWVCVEPIKYTDEGRATMRRDVDNMLNAIGKVNVTDAFLRPASRRTIRMNITSRRKSSSSPSPMPNMRNTRSSPTRASSFRSTTPFSPTCTTR